MSRSVCILLLVQLFTIHSYLFSQTPLSGVSAYYSFSGNANDASGNGLNGSLTGASPAQDRFGVGINAYSFNGANNYINVNANTKLDLKNGFSISAWVNRTGAGTYQTIAGRGYGNDGDYWMALFNTGSNYVIRVWLEGEVHNGTLPVPNGWNHIALVAATGSNAVKLYLNGDLYDQWTTTKDLVGSSAFNLRIGNDDADESYFFNGSIDEVGIYQRALSSEEVQTAMAYPLYELDFPVKKPEFGNALDFDGINDFIDVFPDPVSEVYNGFTVETWVKSTGDANDVIFELIQGYGQVSGLARLSLNGFYTEENNQNPFSYSIPNPIVLDANWHHIAVTVDVTSNIGKFYVDGIVSGTYDLSADPTKKIFGLVGKCCAYNGYTGHQLANLFLMGRRTSGTDFFRGQLDEFRIWDYPRSAEQLNKHKFIPASGTELGLIYYFNFDQGVAATTNTEVVNLLDDEAENRGELLGFQLNGGSSNWVLSGVNTANPLVPKIVSVAPTSSVPGKEVQLFGVNLPSDPSYIKVFFNESEATIVSITKNQIKVLVPDAVVGLNKVRVVNSSGSSSSLDFTIISTLSQLPFTWKKRTLYSQSIPTSMARGDLNGDAFTDIVFGSRTEVVYLKNDGAGNYPTPVIVGNSANYEEIHLVDINSDGFQDILLTENASALVWFRNNGSATFTRQTPILTSQLRMYLEPVDIDRDGDNDIIVFGRDHGIKIFYNNGVGAFPSTPSVTVASALPQNVRGLPYSLLVEDYNGDGYFDICSLSESSPHQLNRFINNKVGGFVLSVVGIVSDYGEVISSADINNDGQVDIADIAYQASFGWRINNGSNTEARFNSGIFTGGATCLDASDLNGDGFTDFLAGFNFDKNQLGGNIRWFKNSGASTITNNHFSLSDISNEVYNAVAVGAADLDNDGDLDALSATDQDNRITAFYHVFSGNDFVTFSLDDQTSPAVISESNHTVDIAVRNETFLAKLLPEFSTSLKSIAKIGSVNQVSAETVVDFSAPGNSTLYTITAENGESQEWTVRIHPLPAAPSLNSISTITETGATINWTNNSFTSSILIEVLKVSADNSTSLVAGYDPKEVSGGSHTISGLTAGSTYQVRLKGKSQYGLSEYYSSILSFATLPVAPSLNPVVNITQVAASVSWGSVSGVNSYRLDLLKDNGSTFVSPYNNFEVIPNNLQLTGLVPGTSYQVRIRSNNVSGSSTNFASTSFITIPPEPVAKEATLKTSTSFQANWDAASTASSYVIELSENAFLSILKEETTALTSSTFTGLELGRAYAYRVRAINESGMSGNSNAIIVVPSYSVSITNESFDGSTQTASVTAISSAGIQEVVMYYRGIATGEYTAVDVPLKSGTTYEISITESMQDVMGCEFYFSVTDGLNDNRAGVLSYAYKKIDALDKQTIPISRSGRGAANYTLFSVPYQLDDDNMSAVFDPVLGAYDINKWRLLRYQDGRHVEYGAGLTKLEPGKGYWFASLNKVDISVSEGSVVEANRTKPYFLNLLRGWNQIGNPYPYAISWNDIRLHNDDLTGISDLYVFEGGTFKKGDLSVWGGGFILSERDQLLEIPVNFDEQIQARVKQPIIQGTDINSKSWELPMTLIQGDVRNELVGLGMDPGASDLVDEFDEQNLPRFIDYLEMHTLHQEYFVPQFMRDVVQTKKSHTWTFHIESSDLQEPITLQWNNQGMGSGEAQLFLIDESEQQLLNMKDLNSYTFHSPGSKIVRFVYAIDKESVEGDFTTVGRPYPNPFRQHTRIPIFGAKEGTQVSMQIYDLQGRELTHFTYVPTNAYEEITWEGTDAQGVHLQPGIYVYKIQFSSKKYFIGRVVLN